MNKSNKYMHEQRFNKISTRYKSKLSQNNNTPSTLACVFFKLAVSVKLVKIVTFRHWYS